MKQIYNSLDACWPAVALLDRSQKKALVDKLIKELSSSPDTPADIRGLSELFGAWDSRRSAEDIIEEIRGSRIFTRSVEDI